MDELIDYSVTASPAPNSGSLAALRDYATEDNEAYWSGNEVRLTLTYVTPTLLSMIRITRVDSSFGYLEVWGGTPESGKLLQLVKSPAEVTFDIDLCNGTSWTVYTLRFAPYATNSTCSIRRVRTYGIYGGDGSGSVAGGTTFAFANNLLDHLLRSSAYTPANLYLGMATSTITRVDTGSTVTEPAGGYARQPLPGASFASASAGIAVSTSEVVFDTATNDWGVASQLFVSDAAAGGNILWYGSPALPANVNTGQTLTFESGHLQFEFSSASRLSNFTRNKLLDHLLGKSAWSPPDIWVGLGTTSGLNASHTLANAGEPSLGNYARIAMADTDWYAPVYGDIRNSAALVWPQTLRIISGQPMRHLIFTDASSGGNLLGWQPLGRDLYLDRGDTMSVPAGMIKMGVV